MKRSTLFLLVVSLEMVCLLNSLDEDSNESIIEPGSGNSSATESPYDNDNATLSRSISGCGLRCDDDEEEDDISSSGSSAGADLERDVTISTPISSSNHLLNIQMTFTATFNSSLTERQTQSLPQVLFNSKGLFNVDGEIVSSSNNQGIQTERWNIVLRLFSSSESVVKDSVAMLLDMIEAGKKLGSTYALSVHSMCYNTSLDSLALPTKPGYQKIIPCKFSNVPSGTTSTPVVFDENSDDDYYNEASPTRPSENETDDNKSDPVDTEDTGPASPSEAANSNDSIVPYSAPVISTEPSLNPEITDTPATVCDSIFECTGSTKSDILEAVSDNDSKFTNSAVPANYAETQWANPGVLAGIVGGGVIGLVFTALLVLFVIYRLRRRDAGSYRLDEPRACSSSSCKHAKSRAPLLPSGPAVLGADFGAPLHVTFSAGPPVAPSMYVLSAKNDPLLAGREYYA